MGKKIARAKKPTTAANPTACDITVSTTISAAGSGISANTDSSSLPHPEATLILTKSTTGPLTAERIASQLQLHSFGGSPVRALHSTISHLYAPLFLQPSATAAFPSNNAMSSLSAPPMPRLNPKAQQSLEALVTHRGVKP